MPHRFPHSSSSFQISVRYHSCRTSCMQRSPLAVCPPTFRPAHHVCSSPVPAFINPTQPGKVAQCCLVLPSSLVLYRRRSLWEAFVQCNRNISPLIILGSSCGAGLTAKGVVHVFALRRWMRLHMVCTWFARRLHIFCASSANSPVILLSAQCPECLVFSCPGFGRVLARMLRILRSHVTDSTGSQQEKAMLWLGCAVRKEHYLPTSDSLSTAECCGCIRTPRRKMLKDRFVSMKVDHDLVCVRACVCVRVRVCVCACACVCVCARGCTI
jgi:hypothetical protein